jgi:hypothetical protein
MKKGATPTNYKTVVQQRLIQDIFKTPHQQDDELSEDDLLTTDQHKPFEGADNATIPLASKTSPASVTTSVAQCLNSSTFLGSFVITMVFNSGFNPFMATASNMSSDIFLFVAN